MAYASIQPDTQFFHVPGTRRYGVVPMSAQPSGHVSVLLDESVAGLDIVGARKQGVFVDCTFGRGGHSRAILQALGADGRLLAFDKDPQAVAAAQQIDDPRFSIIHAGFESLEAELDALGLMGQVDGVLADLGVSSPQLDEAERGFSFARSGPLDMRMNPQAGVSAAEWLADADAKDIADVLFRFGEEKQSRRIARAIVAAREAAPITTTGQLATIIAEAAPGHPAARIHPATRSFQGIRIFINDELGALQAVLAQSMRSLRVGGRLSVISFHSLEDRIVKRFMREFAQPEQPTLPMAPLIPPSLRLIGKAIKPSAAEIAANPRSRSSVLRIAETLPGVSA